MSIEANNGPQTTHLDPRLPPGVFPASSLVNPTIPVNARGMVTAQMRIIGQQYCLSRQGDPYTRLYLGNSEGSITAIAWHDQFSPAELVFEHGQVLTLSGKVKSWKGQSFLNLRRIDCVAPDDLSPASLLPVEWVRPPLRGALAELLRSWADVDNRHLRTFLTDVFQDTACAMGFLNCPAGKRYHHAYQGGLLDHTVEMLVGLRNTALYQASSGESSVNLYLKLSRGQFGCNSIADAASALLA